MCYSVKSKATVSELQKRYDALFNQQAEAIEEYENISGFAHPQLPVITSEAPDNIQLMEWGLVPNWVKDEKTAAEMQNSTLNARSETLFEKPSFRSILKKRCLILVNGFYEWQHLAKTKVPYYINIKSQALFALGGLYDEWVNTNTGELYKGFSIVTVPANPLMERIHNTKKRMPLILPRETERQWLRTNVSTTEINSLMQQYTEQDMQAEEVKAKTNTPTLWD